MTPVSTSKSQLKIEKARRDAAAPGANPGLIANCNSASHEIFQKFTPVAGSVPHGFRVNFLGVKTNTSFFCNDRPYVPSEYPRMDEEYFEWIDLLEAVTSAENSFTMIELGAGYGHWLANAAAALKQYSGLPYHLVGVEAEPTHFRWMKEHLAFNQVNLDSCRLIEAAISTEDGTAAFSGGSSGFDSQSIGAPTPVPAVSLNTIMRDLTSVDLLDVDIQGSELDVLRSAAKELAAKVKRIHVATHNRQVETGLHELFKGLGWRNVHDYAGSGEYETEWGRICFQDGVQTWINPHFFASQQLNEILTQNVRSGLGLVLRVLRGDFITKCLVEDGIFEPAETDLVSRLLRPGDLCLDGGSHVGYYTTLMASLVAPGGQVYAFDANPQSCELTSRSLALNHLEAEVIHAALGDSQGTTAFNLSIDEQTGLSSLGAIESAKQTIFVPWLRLEDFVSERDLASIRLLKLDVEGAEELVLRGLGKVLNQHVIDFILLECYDERLNLLGTSTQRVAGLLREAGYQGWEFGTKAAAGWSQTDRVVSRGDSNYLFASPRMKDIPPRFSVVPALEQKLRFTREHGALHSEMSKLGHQDAHNKNRVERLEKDLDFALDQLHAKEAEVLRLHSALQAVEHSAAWKVAKPWRHLRDRVMPEGGRLRRLYNRMLRPLRG